MYKVEWTTKNSVVQQKKKKNKKKTSTTTKPHESKKTMKKSAYVTPAHLRLWGSVDSTTMTTTTSTNAVASPSLESPVVVAEAKASPFSESPASLSTTTSATGKSKRKEKKVRRKEHKNSPTLTEETLQDGLLPTISEGNSLNVFENNSNVVDAEGGRQEHHDASGSQKKMTTAVVERVETTSTTSKRETKDVQKGMSFRGDQKTRIEISTDDPMTLQELVDSFEAVAGRCTNEILTAIENLPGVDLPGCENDYLALQVAFLRAKQTKYHLERVILGTGVADAGAPNASLIALCSAIELADSYKEDMEKVLPQSKKNFKNEFHSILKTGMASEWLATVSKEMLVTNMKADGNRVYQLLMEGKTLNHLELVDTATLFAAVGRTDLFSSKQLGALQDRLLKVKTGATTMKHDPSISR